MMQLLTVETKVIIQHPEVRIYKNFIETRIFIKSLFDFLSILTSDF